MSAWYRIDLFAAPDSIEFSAGGVTGPTLQIGVGAQPGAPPLDEATITDIQSSCAKSCMTVREMIASAPVGAPIDAQSLAMAYFDGVEDLQALLNDHALAVRMSISEKTADEYWRTTERVHYGEGRAASPSPVGAG